MIEALQKNDTLLADIRQAEKSADQFHVWWFGQSGFLIQWEGKHLLFDPYLSDSLTRKYAETDKPHVSMTEQVIDPSRLDFIDVVTSSHNHTDHLDAETLIPLMAASPDILVVVPSANLRFAAERLKVAPERLTSMDVAHPVSCGAFELHAVPAAHNNLDHDEQGFHKCLGFVVTFGPFSVYHSGDTLRYYGMPDWLSKWRVDLALLPINGNKPERRVAGNLNGEEAAQLAHDIGAGMVVPCHYDMFEFNTETPELFETTCRTLNQPFKTMKSGERLTLSARD
jgi:L-ascorbate metabolism protein UlaG (beta-lactamase superfamily)